MGFGLRLRPLASAFVLLASGAHADDAVLTRQLHASCTILSLAWSPDGRRIAVSDKCGVKVRDAATGALVYAYRPLTVEVPAVVFTPDSQAVVEIDDYVSEFADTPTGYGAALDLAGGKTTTLAFRDYGDSPGQTLDISPDGATLATTHMDGTVRLFKRATGADLKAPPKPGADGPDAPIAAKQAKFAPDGKSLAVLYDDGVIRLADPASGALRRTVKSVAPLADFAFLANDALLTLDRDRRAEIVDFANGKTLVKLDDGAPPKPDEPNNCGLAASRDGKTLAAWSEHLPLRVWTRRGGAPIWRLPADQGVADAAALSPDGRAIAVAIGVDLKVFSLPDGKLAFVKAPGAGFRALRFEADSRAFSAFDEAGVVRRWDAGAGRQLGQTDLKAEGSLSAFDGRLAVIADPDKGAAVFDAASGKPVATVKGASSIQALALSPDDRTLALADRETTKGSDTLFGVTLYSLPDGKKLKALPDAADRPQALAFSADGKALIVGYGPSRVRLFDIASGKTLANTDTTDKGDIYGVHGLALFADGHAFAVRNDFALQVRPYPAGKRLQTIKAAYGLNAFDVAKDGRRLALAGDPVELWSLTGHSPDRKLPIDGEDVDALAFSPDGKRLLIGDEGGELRLFDLDSGALLTTFWAAGSDWAAMAPDGRFVASGELGEFVRLTHAGELLTRESFVATNKRESLR